jgi:cellulose synthase/poly-beta-1,6-N-acetylglucosamine synthase-like glycosyltransferase
MGPEIVAYPFLFLALFFEVFVLLTFLSTPAREARRRAAAARLPKVAVIVPCYNESNTVAKTTESALALDYPAHLLEVILVDDGSKDDTRMKMEAFRDNPRVKILFKENGGKHTALNAGIAVTDAEIVGCLDADSVVEPSALKAAVASFWHDRVAATTAAMSVHSPTNLIQHMQNAEYTFGIMLRHSLSSVNGLYVTPGPFSLYRRDIVNEVGGFREGHQTEDLEMALRLQRAGYNLENAPTARVYTQAPLTVARLIKQRTRWTTGFMRNILNEYRDLIGSTSHGALGSVVLPIAILAILSGMCLFLMSSYLFGRNIIHSYFVHQGIPLTFLLTHMSFDWFYAPVSFFLALAMVVISLTLVLIAIGKKISGTPGSLAHGLVAYVLLYGFIAPFWLMRATADVVTGHRRNWK